MVRDCRGSGCSVSREDANPSRSRVLGVARPLKPRVQGQGLAGAPSTATPSPRRGRRRRGRQRPGRGRRRRGRGSRRRGRRDLIGSSSARVPLTPRRPLSFDTPSEHVTQRRAGGGEWSLGTRLLGEFPPPRTCSGANRTTKTREVLREHTSCVEGCSVDGNGDETVDDA